MDNSIEGDLWPDLLLTMGLGTKNTHSQGWKFLMEVSAL